MIFFAVNCEFQFIILNCATLQDNFFGPFEGVQNLLSTTWLETLLTGAIPSKPYCWDVLLDFTVKFLLQFYPTFSESCPFSMILELIGSEILAWVLSNETTERFLDISRFCSCRLNSPNDLWWHLLDWLFTARRRIPFIIEFLTICLRSESILCLCFSVMRNPALVLKFI